MEHWIYTLLCLYVYGYFFDRLTGIYCDVLEGPLNTVGLIGSPTVLTCTIGDDLQQWLDDYSGSAAPTISIDDRILTPYQGIYSVEGIAKQYNLVLLSTSYDRAGTHTCLDVFVSDLSSAEIIVLESNASCTTNSTDVSNILIEGEYVNYMCNVRYKGLWGPKMTWSSNTGVVINPDDESDDTQDIKLVQHSFTTMVTSKNDGQSLHVVTSFDPPEAPQANSAANAPDYSYTWESPAIIVHYPPHDIVLQHCSDSTCDTIRDITVTIKPNDRIQASASTNPNVDDFIWKNGTDILQEGGENEYTFTDFGISNIECTVRNTMRGGLQGTTSRTIQVMVVATTTPPLTTTPVTTEWMLVSTSPISTPTQPLPCNCDIDECLNGLRPGSVAGVAISCLILGALIPTLVFVLFRRQQKYQDEKPYSTNPTVITNPTMTNTEHTEEHTRGEYEQMNISPYINTRQDRPENNVYADLTKEDTPYEKV